MALSQPNSLLGCIHQQKGHPELAVPSRPANPMEIIFWRVGVREIDHNIHSLQIYPSGQNIGAHDYFNQLEADSVHNFDSLSLGQVCVEVDHLLMDPLFPKGQPSCKNLRQLVHDLVSPALIIVKNYRLLEVKYFQNLDNLVDLNE